MGDRMRERYDYQEPEPQPATAFVPIVKDECICRREGIVIEGIEYAGRLTSPSCTIHTLTADRKYIAEFRYGGNSRTVGVVHGRGGSRNSF